MDYPIVAIADLHGRRLALQRQLARLEVLPEWPRSTVVFLGDLVDRGPTPGAPRTSSRTRPPATPASQRS